MSSRRSPVICRSLAWNTFPVPTCAQRLLRRPTKSSVRYCSSRCSKCRRQELLLRVISATISRSISRRGSDLINSWSIANTSKKVSRSESKTSCRNLRKASARMTVMTSWPRFWAFLTSSLTYWTQGRSNMKLRKTEPNAVVLSSERISNWRFAIWEMDVGPIITSQTRFKRDNTGRRKLSSAQSTVLRPIFGPSRAWSLRWRRETSSSSLEKVRSMVKMTTTWRRWWSCWEECLSH